MNFNEKLTRLRKENNYTQEELGNRIDVTRQTISNWELAVSTPELHKVIELAKLFNISTDELLGMNYSDSQANETLKENQLDSLKNKSATVNNKIGTSLNYFKITWLSIYLLSCFIGGFLPFIIHANFYKLLFSSNYKNGNVICLFIFISIIMHAAFSIGSILIVKRSKILYYAGLSSCALTFNLSILMLVFIQIGSVGLILGPIFHGTNFMCSYFLSSLKNVGSPKIDEKCKQLPFLFMNASLTIIFVMLLSIFIHSGTIEITVGNIALILLHSLFSVLYFLYHKKVFEITQLIISIIIFALFFCLCLGVEFNATLIAIIILLATLHYIFYYLKRHELLRIIHNTNINQNMDRSKF